MPFCLFKTPQPSISLFFILIYSITILIKYTLTKCENNIFRKISKIFNSNPLSATMVWQGVWCNFGLILCKNSLKLHKNKNFCISDFSKNLTFLTNLANILNFICQICKFFKQSSPTSQPSVAHRFIKILKSHTSICKTKSTPFLACTCLFFLYKSIARISPFITIGCGYPTLSVIPSVAWESSRQAQSQQTHRAII